MTESTEDAERTRLERGRALYHEVVGEQGETMLAALAQTSPVVVEQVLAFAFADVYDRPQLDRTQRQLVIIAVLTALGAEPELKVHIVAALRAGLTPEQVTEAILQTVPYSGFPRAINATVVAASVFAQASGASSTPSSSAAR